MLKPSYTDLMDILNKEKENYINSRYSIVIATSKRARQLVDGSAPMTSGTKTDKPVSIAVQEIYESKIKIII